MKVAQLGPAVCDPVDYIVHGILQARIFFPSPGDLPNPGIKPRSPALQVDSLPAKPQGKPIGLECISNEAIYKDFSTVLVNITSTQ